MHKIVKPQDWPPAKGYSNGVLAEGRTLSIAGQIGWTKDQVFEAKDFAGQVAQALKNIVAVLNAADAGPEHLVRMTWYVTDKTAYVNSQREMGAIYRDIIGRNFPAMTLIVVSGLVEDEALVEIEATAVL